MTPQTVKATPSRTPAPHNFDAWIGIPVVLHTTVGELCVPLRGTVLRDAGSVLRFRMGEGWDVDIFKSMVLSVEPDCWTSIT